MTENSHAKKNTSNTYAVIETGGKQYRVSEGDIVKIEKLPNSPEEGSEVSFESVLLVGKGDDISLGTPLVDGVVVKGRFTEEKKDKKIEVVKYKAKSRYFKRYGHRQTHAYVEIMSIS